jgi:hypothetical protein
LKRCLTRLKGLLRSTRPHAVCPGCQGTPNPDCLICAGRGWVNKLVWDDLIPDSIRQSATDDPF